MFSATVPSAVMIFFLFCIQYTLAWWPLEFDGPVQVHNLHMPEAAPEGWGRQRGVVGEADGPLRWRDVGEADGCLRWREEQGV